MRTTRAWVWIGALIGLLGTDLCSAQIVYVEDDAPLGGDGRSWATAYRYLQDGFYDAQDDESVTEIRIAGGVYRPDEDEAGLVTPGDGDASFVLRDRAVSIRGGFRGLREPGDPNEQGYAFETVIGPPDGKPTELIYYLIRHEDSRSFDGEESPLVAIERLSFRDVLRGPWISGPWNLRVERTHFETNRLARMFGWIESDVLELLDSTFRTGPESELLLFIGADETFVRGCMFDQSRINESSNVRFQRPSIVGRPSRINVYDTRFVSVFVNAGAPATFRDCSFEDALLTAFGLEVDRCRFRLKSSFIGFPVIRSLREGSVVRNSAFDVRGFDGWELIEGHGFDVEGCLFFDSGASDAASGLPLESLFSTSGSVIDCSFEGLTTRETLFSAIHIAGTRVIGCRSRDVLAHSISDTLFAGNTFDLGVSASQVVSASTFIDNDVEALFLGKRQVDGCVIVSDVPVETDIRGSVLWGDGFEQGQAGGNVFAEPVFVDELGPDGEPFTGDEDWTLAAGSPGVDLAELGLLDGISRTDLNGNPRFVDSTGDGVFRMDAGAFERQDGAAATCEAELLASGLGFAPDSSLTVQDLTRYVEQWIALNPFADHTTIGANPGDQAWAERDGIVSIEDLTRYVELWLGGCPG